MSGNLLKEQLISARSPYFPWHGESLVPQMLLPLLCLLVASDWSTTWRSPSASPKCCRPTGPSFCSDKTPWPHIHASEWPRECHFSLLFQRQGRQQLCCWTPKELCPTEPSPSEQRGCRVPLQDNCISNRNHTSTLDKQQAAPLLPANRINLNAHRHSWAKSKHRAETKLHHLMAKRLRGSRSILLFPSLQLRQGEGAALTPSLGRSWFWMELGGETQAPSSCRSSGLERAMPGPGGAGVTISKGWEMNLQTSGDGEGSYKGKRHRTTGSCGSCG